MVEFIDEDGNLVEYKPILWPEYKVKHNIDNLTPQEISDLILKDPSFERNVTASRDEDGKVLFSYVDDETQEKLEKQFEECLKEVMDQYGEALKGDG